MWFSGVFFFAFNQCFESRKTGDAYDHVDCVKLEYYIDENHISVFIKDKCNSYSIGYFKHNLVRFYFVHFEMIYLVGST